MRYLILGPLEVRDGDIDVELRGGQQRKLLTILVLHAGEAVSSDRLIDELWDGKPPETAAKALHGYISSLRKQLGPETLETVGAGYRLKIAAEDTDAGRFEELLGEARALDRGPADAKLREALALWRGPALSDFAYDDFARHEIERLDELRLVATERRIDLELELGRHDDLVPELEALVHAHPLRERFRGQLMLALYRSGRQAEALDVYRDGRTVLRDELGLEPSEELQALQRSILAHDDSVKAPPQPIVSRVARRPWRIVLAGGVLIAAAVVAAAFELTQRGSSAVIAAVPDSVAAIDPASGKIVADIPVGDRPNALAFGLGSVWVANGDDGTVTRINPRTKRAAPPIGVGGDISGLAVGSGSVWVADGNAGTVTQIEGNTARQPFQFGAQDPLVPKPIFSIAYGDGHVWATREGQRGDTVVRIDPLTGRSESWLATGPTTGIAVGPDGIWVTTAGDRISRFDPGRRRGKPIPQIQTPEIPIAPLLAAGSLWTIVGYPSNQLWRINPDTGGASPTPLGKFPVADAWQSGSIWVANQGSRSVVQIDPDSLHHVGRVMLDGEPSALVGGDGLIWVAVGGVT